MSASAEHSETHITVESPDVSPVDLLCAATGLAKQRVKLAMTNGAVWITRGRTTKRLRRVKRQLRAGDELHLYYDATILAEVPAEPELITDIGDYSVWDKPYGLRSQGSKWGDHCTVARWAERHLQPERPAFTVHRLDRAAQGLILLAHGKKTAAHLAGLFQKRAVEKRYRVLVSGDFPTDAQPLRVERAIDGKMAISEISLLETSDDKTRSLLDVRIETGRKHQVRRHLAALGHPIIGDRLYGSGADDGMDLQLTAYRLVFECPVSGDQVEYQLAEDRLPTLV